MSVPAAAVTSCPSRVLSIAARSDVALECASGETPRSASTARTVLSTQLGGFAGKSVSKRSAIVGCGGEGCHFRWR